ncbi:putative membrane lipoprotein [Actinidia rufa]|uniref:Putative membrane lipoprotein n=1 Tax=Actinidia rufa TaxID=165716 RepID=A0A7J0GVM5_9ERIC|nr:putative membrane lipoprotein [Actinidia rufa]
MRSLSSVGLALSLVFGCLLFALLAELYYLLWWKRRITNRERLKMTILVQQESSCTCFVGKKPSSLSSTALNPQELSSSMRVTDIHVHEPQTPIQGHSNKDFWPNPFGDDDDGLQDLSGPPSGDSFYNPNCFTTIFHSSSHSYGFLTTPHHHHGISPLFRSPIRSSPPPKFKFLKDAEDKLYRRRLVEEAEKVAKAPSAPELLKDVEDGSFITLNIVGKDEERELNHHSSSSQVLPLSSSPSTFRPPTNKKPPMSN